LEDQPPSAVRLPPERNDKFLYGCGLGCAIQLAFILLGALVGTMLNNRRMINIAWLTFGATQWIAIVPLILKQKKKGRSRLVAGLIVTGCIGLLLSSACASIVLQ
jgi:hypothetical protein